MKPRALAALSLVLPLSGCGGMAAPGAGTPPGPFALAATPASWEVDAPGVLELSIRPLREPLIPGDRLVIGVPGSWTAHLMHPEGDRPNQSYARMTEEMRDFLRVLPAGRERWSLSIDAAEPDGVYHRFDRQVALTLEEGRVEAGRMVKLVYGSIERPVHASFLAERAPFVFRAYRGDSLLAFEPEAMVVETRPGPAVELLATVPSQARVGEAVRLHVTARDRFGNPTPLPRGLRLRASDPNVKLPRAVPPGGLFAELPVDFRTLGFQTVEVVAPVLGTARSNPVRVSTPDAELVLLWGDLHSHTHASRDGVGSDPFGFARDHANLDFYSLTDHASSDRDDPGVSDAEWAATKAAVRRFHEPGRFVTLLGYESSFPAPFGHHNVYFRGDEGPLHREHETKTLERLLNLLRDENAFTVPHHTGVVFGGAESGGVDWTRPRTDHTHEQGGVTHAHPFPHREGERDRDRMRPLVEIYSAHGQSELFDPDAPLAYGNFVLTQRYKDWISRDDPHAPAEYRDKRFATSADGPHYARDGWAMGLKLGVIASSDDHTARPGQPHKGLAAVWTPGHTREAVFDALLARRTYGTTGQRIYLDFRIDSELQGGALRGPGLHTARLEIAGTDVLDWVELVRWDADTRAYSVARRWEPGSAVLRASVALPEAGAGFYYVRLRQEKQVHARDVMAWSSPIWQLPVASDSLTNNHRR